MNDEQLDEFTTFIDRLAGRIMSDLIGPTNRKDENDSDVPAALDRILDPDHIVAVLPVIPRTVYVQHAFDSTAGYEVDPSRPVELVGIAITRDGYARSIIVNDGTPHVVLSDFFETLSRPRQQPVTAA